MFKNRYRFTGALLTLFASLTLAEQAFAQVSSGPLVQQFFDEITERVEDEFDMFGWPACFEAAKQRQDAKSG